MRSVIFVLLGFAAGFFAIAGFADWLPSNGGATVARDSKRPQAIPDDVLSRIAMRLANARSAPQDIERQQLLQRDIDQWILTDPRGCIDWLHREGALGLVRRDHLRDVFASAFQGDLAASIREALQIPNGRLRAEWLETVFEEAQELNPSDAFELMRHLPTYLRSSLGKSIVENLAKKDPAKAWTAILNSRDSWYQEGSQRWQMHHDWATLVLKNWAEKDRRGLKVHLRAILDAAKDNREGTLVAQSLQDLTWSHSDLVVELLAGRERNATLQNLWRNALTQFAARDPEAAIRLMQSESSPVLRKDMATLVAIGLADKDPNRAIQIAKAYAGPNEYGDMIMILRTQASKDPKGAAMHAMGLENVLARTEAAEMVARAWIQSDPAGLADFALKSAPPERGASWLDLLADMHSAGGVPVVSGKSWIDALNHETRVQLGRALRERLTPEAWEGIASSFKPVH